METLKNDVIALSFDEMLKVNGGYITKDTSFGYDVGYIVGWLLNAMGKGASAIKG